MSEEIKKGLLGIVVDETTISHVVPELSALTYRGYKVQDLCDKCDFEEVAFLVLHGELPSKNQLKNSQLLIFVKRGREVEVEYEKKKIISKINTFFGEDICGGIKIIQFEDEDLSFKKNMIKDNSNKFFSKIKKIKNEKIRKSLLKLSKNIKIKWKKFFS